MGSKKAILPFVIEELTRLTDPGDILVDLMAGTHTIGYAMKQRCRVVANDIQHYSRVIGHALLNHKPQPAFENEIRDTLRRYYLTNLHHLEGLFETALRIEAAMLDKKSRQGLTWTDYSDFCEGYPYFLNSDKAADWPEDYRLLFSRQRIAAFKTLNKLEPYSLFSMYYANSYLGVRQAIEVDSLRYAIDKLCDEWIPDHEDMGLDDFSLRCLLMCALISSLNRVNPAPGHWAAFPRVNQKNCDWLKSQRSISVEKTFFRRTNEIETALEKNESSTGPHIAMTDDYMSFIDEVQQYVRQARVVYLDPPYSQGHYSRFYHLIETLVQYDYPDISHTGRYRTDRHQSPFSYKTKVAEAIGKVCEITREVGTTLVISYSHNGTIANADAFRLILEKYYPSKKIELRTLAAEHSKLGQAKRMKTTEYLFTCSP